MRTPERFRSPADVARPRMAATGAGRGLGYALARANHPRAAATVAEGSSRHLAASVARLGEPVIPGSDAPNLGRVWLADPEAIRDAVLALAET